MDWRREVTHYDVARHGSARLQVLDLARCGLSPRSLAPLMRMMVSGPVRTLDLSWNDIGDEGAVALACVAMQPHAAAAQLSPLPPPRKVVEEDPARGSGGGGVARGIDGAGGLRHGGRHGFHHVTRHTIKATALVAAP